MGKFSFDGGFGGGGGGVTLGPAQNTFGDTTTADKAAAEALRDTYATANAAWLALYNGNRAFLIRLVWTGNAQAFQRRNAAGDAWEDVTAVAPGTRGDAGPQGAFKIFQYRSVATLSTVAPTGGSFVIATGVLTPSTDWSAVRVTPAANEILEQSEATINPAVQTGTVTPAWSIPVEAPGEIDNADIDARIAPPARANNPTGEFDAARIPDLDADKIASGELDDARIPAGITRDSENVAASRITGALADSNIPASIARDSEITTQITTQVKEFARTGERGVQVGDMDSESAADNQVPTADGSGSVAWEDQQGAPTPTPPADDHTRYAAASADATFSEAEWLAGATSETSIIVFPPTDHQHRKGFAIPATVASLTDIRVQGSAFNDRNSYNPAVGAADVLQDIGGISHKIYVKGADDFANDAQSVQARTFELR